MISRRRSHARILAAFAFVATIVAGGLVPAARAQTPDASDVVLVLDFSASILKDKTTRNRFGAALERIAARVDETSADLVAGDATVTIVQFATRATDVPNCVDVKLLASPENVTRFANCLRSVAAAYRKGLAAPLRQRIGIDTNYVAAMEQAARHLPATSVRPAMILFTDGKHDVAGVPSRAVLPARDRLFGARTPFALLPVGMGLAAKNRPALTAGLEALRVTRDMPACISGAAFEWPTVVFGTADAAGNAVAVALQDATCTFTAAPTPSPTPTPTPAAVKQIRLTPGDGSIELNWAAAPADADVPVVDYTARCKADGDWIESTEGVSTATTATITGLENGKTYQCEVAAVGASSTGAFTAAAAPVMPIGRPGAPAKPAVDAQNGSIVISEPSVGSGVDRVAFECSDDNGATWDSKTEVSADDPVGVLGSVTNGVGYVCRAFAKNAVGVSDASPLSDLATPCGSTFQCNPSLLYVLGGLGLLLIVGVIVAAIALIRGRTHGYVIAVVDVIHTANIGHGSKLGIEFVRDPATKRVTGIVSTKERGADLRIRRLRDGRFVVRDRTGRHVVDDAAPVVVADSVGVRHSLVLQAFATNAASEVAVRR